MKYIVITKNARFIITEAERKDFLERYEAQNGSLLRLQGQLVDRYNIEIYDLPFFIKSESEKLKLRNLRRCQHCGEINNRLDKCGCSDRKELRKNNPYALEESEKPILLPTLPMDQIS